MSNEKPAGRKIQTTSALAEHLGLSRWTVSRVLNGHPGVKEETRQRVHEAMYELGFLPNAMARGLRGTRTQMVGVCFQELESPILAKKTSILQKLLRDENYRAILELTGGEAGLEEEVVRHFLSMKVDGVVLVGSTLEAKSPILRELTESGLPTVLVDPASELPFSQVTLAREYAMRLVMDHLYAFGHRSFGVLGINGEVPYGAVRIEGLRKEIRRLKLSMRDDVVMVNVPDTYSQDYVHGWKLGRKLLEREELPTALIALNDRVAIGAKKFLQDNDYKIPEDLSIIGFDNLDVTAYSQPSLTTVDQQVGLMMSTAVKLLVEIIDNNEKDIVQRQVIRPVLRERESTGLAPNHPLKRKKVIYT